MCGDIPTHDSSGRQQEMVAIPTRKLAMGFTAQDICDALGLGDHKVAVRKLDDEEKGEYSILLPWRRAADVDRLQVRPLCARASLSRRHDAGLDELVF